MTAEIRTEPNSRWWSARFAVAVLATGVLAGAGGIVLTLLLHLVQHLAYGYSEESFLFGAERAAPSRRLLVMACGGLLIGAGWWALRRWTTPVPAVADAIEDPRQRFRLPEATTDAALQIVGVGIGASLGREGAPRLLGAAIAERLSAGLRLDTAQRHTVVACGAGAGLAAVYNVPLGGALFTLEILLGSAKVRDVVPALMSSAIAAASCWPVLSSRPTYTVAIQGVHPQVMVWALLLGPVAGVVSVGFTALVARARAAAPTGWKLVPGCALAFTAVGALSMAYPALLGNGKGLTQLALDGTLSVLLLTLLVILKPLVTAACLAGGAIGGLLTPALATGALL
ncbi:MAG: chloride channel protein, partial [Actinomycetota bacterium]|nr:chloride channel protein [Actinomycetota bacterium]